MAVKHLSDGVVQFNGGMDSSREPNSIGTNQYAKGINYVIPHTGERIRTRPAFVHQRIEFEDTLSKEIYENGHIQGFGWYDSGTDARQLRSVNGYVFEFQKQTGKVLSARILNRGFRNNPNRTKAWFQRIPGGCIMQDGEGPALHIANGEAVRLDSTRNQIGVGRMMAYVQNRLWWVNMDGTAVFASNYRDPLSMTEAAATQLFGFVPPEDIDRITAVGVQKNLQRDINGGELVFSTSNSIYSADVRGDPITGVQERRWEPRLQVAGQGATSDYSFESFNSNLWYRTVERGMMNFKQSQVQFLQDEDTTSHSVEVNEWFENDTEWMLDQCYSVNYKGRLFTTVAPRINKEGYAFWSGFVSMNPDPVYSDRNKQPRRWEGLMTGVRPWGMIKVDRQGTATELYIDSHDRDGVNRMYRVEDTLDHDIDHQGTRKEIAHVLETRSFNYNAPFLLKRTTRRRYSIHDMWRDVDLKCSSRKEGDGEWIEFHERNFKIGCPESAEDYTIPRKAQRRDLQSMSDEKDEVCSLPGGGGDRAYDRAYRFDITGAHSFDDFVIVGHAESDDENVRCGEEKESEIYSFRRKSDFLYSVAPYVDTPGEPGVTAADSSV